jgi:hypothetical protein
MQQQKLELPEGWKRRKEHIPRDARNDRRGRGAVGAEISFEMENE